MRDEEAAASQRAYMKSDLEFYGVRQAEVRSVARAFVMANGELGREELRAIAMPTLVVSGAEDHDNGSAEALAGLLPDGHYVEIPGNHMSAVTKPELGGAIAEFLAR